MKWTVRASKYLSQHRYFTARVDTCEMPDGTIVDEYFVVELPASVCALAVTEDGKAILVKQYRHPVEEALYEIPGGFTDPGETPEQSIARELQEETGYCFEHIYPVGKTAANPGVLNNYTYLFLATGGKPAGSQQLDHFEDIQLEFFPLEEVRQMLKKNQIVQALHSTCMLYAFQKWDELQQGI